MSACHPYPVEVLAMDTTDDDMTILPATMRTEVQIRCGCTRELEKPYGHD